ncbi:MAG: sugar ABC transporter ATP-binding protein [Acidimicrobiia bacterium]|nr:sugar ABC transporter ATP-binding protein [Acidimicrobiia bacterium]
MSESSLLEARTIAKRYGPVVALRSADLTVQPGEIHALLGANGAGKSTLVKILSAVFPADIGTITVQGTRAALGAPTDAVAAGIATVFQDPALIPDLSLAQNLRISRLTTGDVLPWLERMNLSHIDFELQASDVPLAVLRLLDLARALARDPQLLLLDEITAALTSDQADYVFDVMREWRDRGRSVLFITHRLGEVLAMCDRATILRNGVVAAQMELTGVDEAELVTAMLGEELIEKAAAPVTAEAARAPSSQPVALAARDLRLRDKVNGVSFELHRGEILGLTALEGQGQDELFQVLSGDHRPSSGELLVAGEPLKARSPYDAIRRGLVLVPADRQHALLPQRSVRENLASPLYNRASRWFSLARDEASRVDRAVQRLDIDVRAGSQVQRLSGGNQQKVTIGRWLAAGFDTLLCFDPTRGIDIQTKAQIYDLLKELAAEGAAVFLYTSELPEIQLVCDRVLVMYAGRIVHEQDAASANEDILLTAAHDLGGVGA